MKKAVIIFLGVFCAFITLLGIKTYQFYQAIHPHEGNKVVKPTLPPEKTSYNILVMGIGGAGHDGANLTDTLIVAHIDIKAKKVVLVSLPRDIWAKVPGKAGKDFHAKINEIYTMGLFPNDYPQADDQYTTKEGSTGLVKKAVADITGLKIDGYIVVDFSGFKKVIDMIGGIDVNVEIAFDDYEYPIDGKEDDSCGKKDQELEDAVKQATEDARLAFPCRYEHLHFDKGEQHMDAETALKYARSRHSLQDGTDFGRAARQQKVIEAVKEKVLSIGFLTKIIPLLDEEQKHIKTDLELKEFQKFFFEAKNSKQYTTVHLVPADGNQLKDSMAENGQFILIPTDGVDQWGDIQTWISNTIEGITPTPTPPPITATPSGTLKTKKIPTPKPTE